MIRRVLLFLVILVLVPAIATASDFFLKQTLFEGESTTYTVGSYEYKVTLLAVFDSKLKAQFEINGEKTDALSEDELFTLSDGARIQVRDVLPQESGDGRDLVQFNFFPVAHPEAEHGKETLAAPAAAEPSAATMEAAPKKAEPEKTVQAAPERDESIIDITRKQPSKSWWESMIDWLKNLFS